MTDKKLEIRNQKSEIRIIDKHKPQAYKYIGK